ncbi:Replication protein A 32 kDa subunit [Sarcoptes scabiei]|uniref:Replication protein A 32 kDa subunit n=2 Tax=Sarcoptes scabiei TaxID=52283 RepID=A0A834REH3_SARSC|nr:Replication protein A 32 kDa subunit [Sarcoptes scabiei]
MLNGKKQNFFFSIFSTWICCCLVRGHTVLAVFQQNHPNLTICPIVPRVYDILVRMCMHLNAAIVRYYLNDSFWLKSFSLCFLIQPEMGDFFNSSQYDQGNDQVGQVSSTTSAENVSAQNLVHVTLSQIAKLTRREESLVMYRQKIHSIVAIGMVVSVEELTTKNIYTIDDYTLNSPIEAQLWKNEAEGTFIAPPTVLERTYIRVIGQVRYDARKPFIIAFRIETIDDPNDIYCHFLRAIHDSLFLEKRMNATLNSTNDPCEFSNSNGIGDMNSNDVHMSGFSEIQRTILNILNKQGRDTSCGLKRYEIRNFMSGVSASVIDEAISFLVNEGHIFSTTDEDTFKSTDY